MRSAWPLLLLLLLLLPASAGPGAATAQAPEPPLRLTIEDLSWQYGPETWKQDIAFQRALGSRLDVTLGVSRDGEPAPSDWSWRAVLGDGARSVEGDARSDGTGRVVATFDVDGHRPLPDKGRVPPLAAGTWALRLEASSGAIGPSTPEGHGVARFEARSIALASVTQLPEARGIEDAPWLAIPAGIVPGLDETSGAPDRLLAPMVRTGEVLQVTVDVAAPDVPVLWTAWSLPAAPTGPAGTELALTTSDAAGRATLSFSSTSETPMVLVLSAEARDARGGSGALVVGVGPGPTIQGVAAPPPGGLGPLQVRADGVTPGSVVHAIAGADAPLSSGVFLVPHEGGATAVLDPTPVRAARLPAYHLLAIATTAGLDYRGHNVLHRGLEVDLDVPLLGAGVPAAVAATFRNAADGLAPGHAVAVQATLTMDDRTIDNATFHVPAGGVLQRTWTVTPQRIGSTGLTVHVDTGDMLFEQRATAPVVSADEHARETGAWRDRLTPAPPIVWLLAGLILLATRRRGTAAQA